MNQQLNAPRIALGDLNNPQDVQRLTVHIQTLYNNQIPVVIGSGIPKIVPPKISAQYIDTKNNQVYVATGNSLISHWVKVS